MAASQLTTLSRTQIASSLEAYPSAIAHKSSLTPSKPNTESLVALDEWYHSLPTLSGSKGEGRMRGKQDLIKLMQWKLAREKFRPTLLSLISSNDASICSEVLQRAATHLSSHTPSFELDTEESLKSVESTMRILAELRGIGPATSSAIVATWSPMGVFQSDELAQALLGDVKIEYTWTFYRKFYRAAIETMKKWQGEREGKVLERVAWSMAHTPTEVPSSVAGKEVKQKLDERGEMPASKHKDSQSNSSVKLEPKETRSKREVKDEASAGEGRVSKRLRSR
ncbi:hypothetical protein PSEUBRA_001316 [Kalmanozyma brasiliensis GHG001]|uniref:Uncharacterized protein n=1 Tax=Kalmanozyma brasiliensis (strain GHG001) TaxID=1365824 RepID=V5EYT8_KALBG|nr:uncharacterized protein PSEUBRA_001316 [Kalmanozyma brasiliensis GHG001]EST08988.1 hypothetical protein PSEUBRA_001316 [Kalmanozyma brasiliensis GHG001]